MEFFQGLFNHILQIFYDWGDVITFVVGTGISIVFAWTKVPKKKEVKILVGILLIILVSILSFYISSVKKKYTFVPEIDFGNQSLQEVHSKLDRADLQCVDKFDEEAQKHKDKGKDPTSYFFKVVDCNPKPGEFVEKKMDVYLCVSWIEEPDKNNKDATLKPETVIKKSNFDLGGKLWKVPDVNGLAQEVAEKVLRVLGIPYYIGEPDHSDTIEKGRILSQTPEAGTVADEDTKVVLVVSKGIKPVQVPNVVGLSQKEAKNKLEKLGLKVTVEELSLIHI